MSADVWSISLNAAAELFAVPKGACGGCRRDELEVATDAVEVVDA